MGRISSLYRVSLLCKDNVESRARRGKSWRKTPVALCVTACRCLVKRSLESWSSWCYRIELWGCSCKWNIVIMQRSQSQNSKTQSKCTPVCNKSYSTYRFQHLLRYVIHERINKHHNNPEAHPNPLLEPLLQRVSTRILKRCWPLDLTRHLKWERWMNCLQRHNNTLYCRVVCIIGTLACRLFYILIAYKYIKNVKY